MTKIAEDFTHQFPKKKLEPTDRVMVYDKNNTIKVVDNEEIKPDEGLTGTYVLGDYNVTITGGIITEITSAL